MTERKRRKKNKLRGHRTHGKGDTKNKRGAGSKGGRGRAGSHKHKFTKYYGEFGKEKKKILAKKTIVAINIDELNKMVDEKIKAGAIKDTEEIHIDGKEWGIDKILGRGKPKYNYFIENTKISKKADEKLNLFESEEK